MTVFAQTGPRVEPIDAQAIREPLQRKSITFQRLRRAYLLSQLNRVLPAQDTAYGIVITLPDSMLAGTSSLPQSTADRLARIAEILPPDVSVRVLGYTDDRGSSTANQQASYGRAEAVGDVLSDNDNVPRTISVAGFVSSARVPGRSNRRVEIVISGEGIGTGRSATPRTRA